jgi:hypothetical protein
LGAPFGGAAAAGAEATRQTMSPRASRLSNQRVCGLCHLSITNLLLSEIRLSINVLAPA